MRAEKLTIAIHSIILLSSLFANVLMVTYIQECRSNATGESEDYSLYFPPRLSKEFYPNNLTRRNILDRLPEANTKSGLIEKDEEWVGVVKITGDLWIAPNATINIQPGTIVFVATRSDDQKTGVPAPKDLFNPKAPARDEEYVKSRVEISIRGNLVAKGIREQPIIITSDSQEPQTDDWLGIVVESEGNLEMRRVVMEYLRILGIKSSQVNISQSILRNMMGSIVIMGEGEKLFKISPVLTQNYFYNIGQFCVTVRSGSPIITHNIFRPRQDMGELILSGFEYGCLAVDHPSVPVIEHNFFEGTGSAPYNENDILGKYHEFIEPTGLCTHASIAPTRVANNTFYRFAFQAMEAFPGPVTIENNNFLNNSVDLVFQESLYEPSDVWQRELFEKGIIQPTRVETVLAPNNFWSAQSKELVEKLFQTNQLVKLEFEPFRKTFIREALPNWQEFSWGVRQRSKISLSIVAEKFRKGEQMTVSGSLNPALTGIVITLTFKKPDGSTFLRDFLTDFNGSFTWAYAPDDIGNWSMHANWMGNENYEGTSSSSPLFTVEPPLISWELYASIAMISTIAIIIVIYKKRQA